MRTASDGRGDEPWNEPAPASADHEATQVFSRDALPGTSPETDSTRPPAIGDTGPRAGTAEDTREFARHDPSGPTSEGTAFTRRFVRDRPGNRSDPGIPVYRDEAGDRGRGERRDDHHERDRDEPYGERYEPLEEPYEEPRRRRGRGAPPSRPPRVHTPKRRRPRRFRLRWIVTLLLLVALAIPPGTWGWVWYTARQDDRTASDAIVVLGASQYNGVPSPVFEARLRQAQVLYLEGVAPHIVTVGGKQPDDAYTEAEAGRNWLIAVGVPADHVTAVEQGSDTLQSFQAMEGVFEDNGWETAILVSDPWHSLRSKVMAADHGIEAGTSPSRSGPAVIERRTQLWYITRETASLWYYWIFNDSSDIRVNAA
ncbi:YdcF family protein [Nocardiopsis sp. NPDC006938]|uniref:YdcF family protein n=1 Tax=Nocardiopsis sp. NPDC006938 TaxID=3364337 RepID=UPI0036851BAA